MSARITHAAALSGLVLVTAPAAAQTRAGDASPVGISANPPGPQAAVRPARAAASATAARSAMKKTKRDRAKEHSGPIATLPGFAMRPDGTSVVFVSLTGAPVVEEHAGKGFVTYVLKDTEVDRANNKNPLETAFYDTPVLRARLRTAKKDPDAELAIELRADVKPTYKVVSENGQSRLEVVFPAGKYARADFEDGTLGHRRRRAADELPVKAEKKRHGKSGQPVGQGDDGRKGPKAP